MFDLEAQFTSIFANSRFDRLANVAAILDWKFYEDFTFYAVAALVLWAVGTLLLFGAKKEAKEYCIVSRIKNRKVNMNGCSGLCYTLSIAHPLINIYCISNQWLSKYYRTIIYFTRLLFGMTFASFFGRSPNRSGFQIQPVLIALPLFVVTPLQKFIEAINMPRKNFPES